jgi:glutathione S-transferase/3-isopropylmalate dehydratase
MMPVVVSRFIAPEAERENWGATWCLQSFQKRLKLVSARLASSHYLAGEAFTAADISVTYALNLAQRNCGITLGDAEQGYLARTTSRDAYKRAMERSHEGVNS